MHNLDLDIQTNTDASLLVQIGSGLLDGWNSHDVEKVMQYYAPGYEGIDVGQANPLHGPDGKRTTVLLYLQAFPDLHFEVENTISQDNTIAVSWIASGTHRGSFMRIPPTGRQINVRGVSMLTIKDSMIVHAVYIWDVAGMLRNIGILPDL